MSRLKYIGLFLLIVGMSCSTLLIFVGKYTISKEGLNQYLEQQGRQKGLADSLLVDVFNERQINDQEKLGMFGFLSELQDLFLATNDLLTPIILNEYGVSDPDKNKIYSSVFLENKYLYSEGLLEELFAEDEQKVQLLSDHTSWMFSDQKDYPSLTDFKKDFEQKISEINHELLQNQHLRTDRDALLNASLMMNVTWTQYGRWWALLISIGSTIVGAIFYFLGGIKNTGDPSVNHHGIFKNASTGRGWIAGLTMGYFVIFYIVLYFFPYYLNNLILLVSPISERLSGNPASQWFLYGLIYTVVMTVMAIRMFIKYRKNRYQLFRTAVVLFFQIVFAFLIPEILVRFNQPYFDFKNAWPLDYDFFFQWNIKELITHGKLGWFMLFWGIVLTLIIVPIMVYFFGKRWYCSWVCGCGGLAETLGDPYRQHSDKSLRAWRIERYLIHGVLVFAILMTALTLYTFFSGRGTLLGVDTYWIQSLYGFLIGSIFAGVIGTGFYPVFGNRVWCRFGCPLAAYMGIIQRFKSRFRITTNGGQCISCGNCSTYCEQGIDVRAYAQKGEDIVRASCVGCGVCASVCPRGVLKLENSSEAKKINDNPLIFENNMVKLRLEEE